MKYPSVLPFSLRKTIEFLTELPSIGPRQATRLAFFLVGRGAQFLSTLSESIGALGHLKFCERCFFVHEESGALCGICANKERTPGLIMIVEKETDLLSIENTGKFTGRYLVLGEIPRDGMLEAWQKLRLQALKSFIERNSPADGLGGKAKEIILGLNPTSLGDFHASLLAKELAPYVEKISRLGRGLPTGGEIEFADDETLGSALERRS